MQNASANPVLAKLNVIMKNVTFFAVMMALAVTAHADQKEDIQTIWKDPVFQRQFIAGYGINSEIEPRVTPEDIVLLEKIRPLMATDMPKAAKTLSSAMKPECSAILDFTLGSLYFQQDQMIVALDCYRKAVAKFPSFRRAYRNLGLIYTHDGKYDNAIQSFTRMIELGGGDAFSFGLLAMAYSAKQDYIAAECAYRSALLLQPDNTDWRLGLSRCIFKQQKYEEAAALLDVLIERFPERTEFWLLQANAYIGLKQPLRAAENYEIIARMNKATVDSCNTLGDIYVNENLPDLAARAYVKGLEIDPTQLPARPLRDAEILAGRGALPQAKIIIERIKQTFANRLEESDRRKLLRLEARIAVAGGAGSEATKALEEIVALDPLDGEALMLLGQLHGKANEPEKAIFYYERAENIETFEANAKIRHAQLLVAQSKYQEAVPLLRRAQELKPQDDVARYLEQVERIAKSKR